MAEPPPELGDREIRDKLGLWDRRPRPTAPLTDRQTDSVLELKAAAENPPVPAEVSGEGPGRETVAAEAVGGRLADAGASPFL